MQPNGPPVCDRCGVELRGAFDAVLRCAACRAAPPAFAMARAPWRYEGPVRQAVHEFKYRGRWRLGPWLAEDMARCARALLPLQDIDGVVAVPLFWLKRRLRGADAAGELAGALARALGKPLVRGALRRTRWTSTQTRWQGRRRRANVRGAFAARRRLVEDRTLLLVDDVLTTGATAHACATALRQAGARKVLVLAAARTPLTSSSLRV